MKRSEMVEILRNLFNKHMNCVDCCVTDKIMYSTILDGLEEEGMAPPMINHTPDLRSWEEE